MKLQKCDLHDRNLRGASCSCVPTSKTESFRQVERLEVPDKAIAGVSFGGQAVIVHAGLLNVDEAHQFRDWLNRVLPPDETPAERMREALERIASGEPYPTGIARWAIQWPKHKAGETSDIALDARRYRRLQVLGCAVMNTPQLEKGLVSRWTNLDAIIDADLKAHPSRGEDSPLEPAPVKAIADQDPNERCGNCDVKRSLHDAGGVGSCRNWRAEKASGCVPGCTHSWTVIGNLGDPRPEQLCNNGCGLMWTDRFSENGIRDV